MNPLPLLLRYLKKRFPGFLPNLYNTKGLALAWWCTSRVDSTFLSFFSWRALPPIHRVKLFVTIFPLLISMFFLSPNRFLASVNQDLPSREGRVFLYFIRLVRLGRSRHSRNFPVHRSITRVSIPSTHSE